MSNPDLLGPRVRMWILKCFGPKSLTRRERAIRLVEEAVELAQAEGISKDMIGGLTARVYSRPPGEPEQEAAGVAVTLIGWAEAANKSVYILAENEISRVEALPVEYFKARHRAKVEADLSEADCT